MIQDRLNEILPDEKLFNIVKEMLEQSNYVLDIDKSLIVPKDICFEIVYRKLDDGDPDAYFCPLTASISIGETYFDEDNVLKSPYYFVVLHFDSDLNLVTSDWDREFY
ncbi:MAG: hypothetical protein KC646_13805 [Candidatus Cloacimonetes bacterium]|nr:hypothetical protein [Candidatus Cloacimonadota bacterium]